MKKKPIWIGVSIVTGVTVLTTIALLGATAQLGGVSKAIDSLLGRQPQAAASSVVGADSRKPSYLTCAAVRDRTKDFLRLHYSFRTFSEELSSRTFNRFFQVLDPGKNFFLASDIEKFRMHERTIPVALARLDCKFIDDIYNVFLNRVRESEAIVNAVVPQASDFSKEESIETDRRKIVWAASSEELKDRWRKQLKFLALSMKDADLKKDDIVQKLKKRHELIEKSTEARSRDEVNGLFLDAFANSLDPHSNFDLPEDQADFKMQFALSLVGIGAQLSSQDGFTVVEGIIPGGPAERDGQLKKGDKIIAVDSGDGAGMVDVVDMDLNKVVQRIRGKKDTLVKLTLLRKDDSGEVKKFILELVRDVVNLPDGAAKSEVMEIDGKRIGVINLPGFYIDYAARGQKNADYRSSANDVARELVKLQAQKVDGIVLDLRRNGGGDLGECIRMTGFFIDSGSVVQVQGREGEVESLDDREDGYLYKGPLAVMVSRQSASASEILAGALKDYGRAVIVGDTRTYGKGTVQNVIEVPGTRGRDSDGALKVTVSKFFQPSGTSNQAQGVKADVVIPDVLDAMDISEERNDYVLPHGEIKASRTFRPLQNLTSISPELQRRSAERVAKSKEFQELLPQIKKAEKERDNTAFPLKPGATERLKTDKKGIKPTPNPKGTPEPKATPEASKVIDKDDIQLREAAHVLVDVTELLGRKTDWTK